ncbi:LIM domain-containing protein A-like [Topomyia yanbarensis]|uniref:LIM domain-containing protein A-like n=1 Tax=Topomyia yanbarensis TaxID=2498891 RepID=UPI00273CC232|nr:LIM domain-containing protein A-like [Topomyia yanbarensis]
MSRPKMWKIINLLLLLTTNAVCILAAASYDDNVIEKQHRVINEMNQNFSALEQASEKLIDLGTFVGRHKVPPKTVKITNTVAVKVPVPYPVKIPHPVPIPIPVNKPVPVPVTKIVLVKETSPTSTVPSYSTTALQSLSATPTATAFSSRSSGPTARSQFLSNEQDTSQSEYNERFQEYVRSYPVHSVFNVGTDYNPYMGNRLALTKQTVSASEPQHSKYYEPEHVYRGRSTNIHSSHPIPSSQSDQASLHAYHQYVSTVQPEEAHSSADRGYHRVRSTPETEVIPHSYKYPKSTYFSKSYDKYSTPKFPRPTHSPFPTTPTFSTSEHSNDHEYRFEGQHYEEQHPKPAPTAHHFQTVKESYPHYEHPDFKQYRYQKPTSESHGDEYSEKQHYKQEKYQEHYEKPTASSYTSDHHETEHRESDGTGDSAAHYRENEYQANAEPYDEHESPSQQYDSHDQYSKQIHAPETYSHTETREPHYTPQEYKTYYANPSPVSEALSYTEEREPSRDTEHKQHYEKPESYRPKPHKIHKTRYSSKPNTIEYNFPSDSHLHPSYSESPSPKHKSHHYYSSTPEHPSFDENHESEDRYYYVYPEHSPSPASSSHEPTYHHAAANEENYHQQSYHEAHHRHERESGADMMASSSTDHEAYERAVERDHRKAHSDKNVEYSHEHLHHHHRPTTDGRKY